MPKGRRDEFLKFVREGVETAESAWQAKSAPVSPPDPKGVSSNHLDALYVSAYYLNPIRGKLLLMDWQRRQLRVSGVSMSEPLSLSHFGHWAAGRGGALLFALRNEDEQEIELACEIVGRELALMSLVATPDNRIVSAHARSPFHPDHKDPADQRVMLDTWWAMLTGKRWRRPDSFEIGDDWLGHWAVAKAMALPGWDDAHRAILSYLGRGVGGLPLMRDRYEVQRGPHGVLSHFPFESDWQHMGSPAVWATSDFRAPVLRRGNGTSADALYGFGRPVPDCPQAPGDHIETTRLQWSGGPWGG